jgi:Pentatricopeptide repeat domain
MIGFAGTLPRGLVRLRTLSRRASIINPSAAIAVSINVAQRAFSGPSQDDSLSSVSRFLREKDATSSYRDAVFRPMTQAQDKHLTGATLLDFVKACNAAGIDIDHTQQRVGHFMKTRDPSVLQSRRALVFVLQAWKDLAADKPEVASKEAEHLLYDMLRLYLEGKHPNVKPCRDCFALVLAIHTTSGNVTAADRVLQDMLHLYQTSQDDDFRPDRQCFSWVLLSLFDQKPTRNTVYIADNILSQLMDLAIATNDPSLRPPDSVLQHTFTLWALSRSEDAGLRAEALLCRMLELPGRNDALPPLKVFELVMQSWAISSSPKAAARIQRIRSMVQEHFQDSNALNPTFGLLEELQAVSRSCSENPWEGFPNFEDCFRRFQQHFRDPNLVSKLQIILAYKAKIVAYSSHRDPLKGARECQEALEELLLLRKQKLIDYDPDWKIYSQVAYAWSRIGHVEQVKNLMERMKKGSQDALDISMYNHLLMALSRSGDPTAGQQAEKVFLDLQRQGQHSRPNIHTYGNLMACLSKSTDPKTASRAAQYFQKLKELYEITGDDELRPDARIYTTAIRSLVNARNHDALERAQALIDEMNALAHDGHEALRPNVITYTTFLKVIRVAKVPNKAQRAEEVLAQMKQNGVEPDSYIMKEINKLREVGSLTSTRVRGI